MLGTADEEQGSSDDDRVVRPAPAAVRSVAGAPAGPADPAPRRRADLGQARGLQLRDRLRRQQDPQAGVPGRRRAGQGLRHARLDRRRAVQPHPPGRGGRGQRRPEVRAGAGELGGLAGRRLRQGRQHPDQPAGRRRRAAGPGRVRDRLQGELGTGAAGGRGARRHAVRHPGRRVRPPARRPRLRPVGVRGRRAGAGARRLLRHDRRVLGDRQHPGRHGRRLRRAGARPGGRPRRVLGIDASAKPAETREQVARIARHTAGSSASRAS